MTVKALKRRTVLKGAGGIAMALPFLDAMVRPRRARAASTPGKAKRLITFFSANGTIMNNWTPPTGGETDFTLSEILSPLQAHRDKLVLLKGLNNEMSYHTPGSNPHDMGMGTMFTAMPLRIGPSGLGRAGHIIDGTVGGPSLDQVLAGKLAMTVNTPRQSMVLGVQSTSTILEPMVLRMSYRGPNDPVIPEDDPGKAFASLFGDTMQTQKQVMDLQKRRTTVLDAVLQDYNMLMTRLGPDDRAKLDRHATSIREVEHQISTLGAVNNCHGVPQTMPTASLTPRDCLQDGRPAKCVGDFPTIGKAQMDVLVLALACDLTRVVSLQWSTAESTVVHSWLQITGEHHLMSHDVNANAGNLTKVNKWYAQQLAYLLDKLQAVTDDEGTTLLDGSVVAWINELSEGGAHDRRGLAYLLAGKGNGALRSGRYLTLNGQPHNQLFAALLNMFPIPAVTGFGDPMFTGVLPGLG
jgi:hypothetical protein